MKLIVVPVLVLAVLTVTEAFVHRRLPACPPCPTCPPLRRNCERIPRLPMMCECCPKCFLQVGDKCGFGTDRCGSGLACFDRMYGELEELERVVGNFSGTCQKSMDRREDELEAMLNPFERLEQPEMKSPFGYGYFEP